MLSIYHATQNHSFVMQLLCH